MRLFKTIALAWGLTFLAACAAPGDGALPPPPSATTVPPASETTVPAVPPEPSATPSPVPTETPSATPTPAIGMLPIAPENLSQLRVLWRQDHAVEGSESDCYLMDCLAPSRVLSFAFSPDGARLALGTCDAPRENRSNPRHYRYYCEGTPQVILVDSQSGAELMRLETAEIPLSIAFHPQRQVLALGLVNRDIELWDLETPTLFRTLSHTSKRTGVVDLAFSPAGDLLVSEGDDTLQVWNWESPPFLQDTIRSATGVAFSPDGRWLATEHLPESSAGAFRIRLYDLPYTGHFIELPTQMGWRLAFSPDSTLLIAQRSSEIHVWDVQDGEQITEYALDTLGSEVVLDLTALFTPEGSLLWALSEGELASETDSTAEPGYACGPLLWDPRTGRGAYSRYLDEACFAWEQAYVYLGSAWDRRISSDGRFLMTLGDGELQLWGIDPTLPAREPVCQGACADS